MTLLSSVVDAVRLLERHGVDYAMIGGLAVSARSLPRFTRDADLAVAVADDAAAEAVAHEFLGSGYRLVAALEHDAAERLSGLRLLDPAGVSIDLLFASSGIEAEVVANADDLEIVPGTSLRVASIGDLIALKLLAVDDARPTDRVDLDSLASVAQHDDWAVATRSVALIEERGFARGRDLSVGLAAIRPH